MYSPQVLLYSPLSEYTVKARENQSNGKEWVANVDFFKISTCNRLINLPGFQEKTWKTQKLDYLSSWGSSELLDPIFGVSEKVDFFHDGKSWDIDDSSIGGENSFGW